MRYATKNLMSGFSLLAAAVLFPSMGLANIAGDAANSNSNWSFAFDNDILVPGSRDQDYTYGLNLTFAGQKTEDQWASLHTPLGWLDKRLGLASLIGNQANTSKIEYGLFGFTPEDITLSEPAPGDRPYASLVYVSSSKERFDIARQVSWISTLTLGIMGLDIVGDIQDTLHANINNDRPQGWDNQISDGGEPTARYTVARQNLITRSDSGLEIKSTLQGSVGYITEASWSLSLRAGRINSPWISYNPELTSYGEKSISSDLGRVSEHYFSMGLSLKARAYNSFLQGQFKNSTVSYNSDELNHGIMEAWAGYSAALAKGYSFSYQVRGHSSELKQGVGDRNVVWGSLQIHKHF